MSTTPIFRANGLKDNLELRLRLLGQGYEPIPTIGKEIFITGWRTGEITEDRVARETRMYADHANTGLRTGRLVGIDIDLIDPEQAALIQELTEAVIGVTPLRRRGSKGAMLCYRNTDPPIGKVKLIDRTIVQGKRKGKTLVEIFGDGGQFIAYGIHPNTKRPYRWLVEGQEPLLVPFAALPPVSVELLRQLQADLRTGLAAMGYEVDSGENTSSTVTVPAGSDDDAEDITQKFLRLLPSSRMSPRGYRNFSCPACGRNDYKSGLRVWQTTGGFDYHCFHTSCEYNDSTGWQPGSRIGERTIRLYELMGGDRADLKPKERYWQGANDRWQDVLAELIAERDAQTVTTEDSSAWDSYLAVRNAEGE
jgi:hypothetical protein